MIRFKHVGQLPLNAVVAAATLPLIAVATSRADLVNGNFEDTTGWTISDLGTTDFPPGWTAGGIRTNAAAPQTGANAIGGSGTSAFMPANNGATGSNQRELSQMITKTGPQWQFEMDFATEDPGSTPLPGTAVGTRALSGGLFDAQTNTIRTLFVVGDVGNDGKGDLLLFKNGTYENVLPNSVIFDADVQTSPLVHRLVLMGTFDSGVPTLSVSLTDSDGMVHSATGLGDFILDATNIPLGASSDTDGMGYVSFNTFVSTGDYLIDNVSLTSVGAAVPEPKAIALWLVLGAVVVAWQWRQRQRG